MRSALAALLALVAAPAIAQDFGGLHVGINLEGAAAGLAAGATPQQMLTGARVIGEVGYDIHLGPLVAGVRAEAAIGTVSGSVDLGNTTVDWTPGPTVVLAGRAGMPIGMFLPYVVGGVLVGTGSTSAATTGQSVGVTAGVGVEAQVLGPLSLKGEVRWTGRDLPELTTLLPPGGSANLNEVSISTGVLARF